MEQNACIFVHNFHSPSKECCQTPEKLKIQSQATLTTKCVAIAGVHKMCGYCWCTQNVWLVLVYTKCVAIAGVHKRCGYCWCTQNVWLLLVYTKCVAIAGVHKMPEI